MPHEALDSAASQSQGEARRKVPFAVGYILAKIYVTQDNPTPLTDGNKELIDSAFVFVMIPPKEPTTSKPPTQDENAKWRGWRTRIDILLTGHKHSNGDFKYLLNIRDMITKNLIYKKIDTGEYYYVVQMLDILGGRDDDSRLLVSEKDFQDKKQFNLVGHSEFRGGNKCSLKPKSNKRNKKQNKLNSRRRRYRSRKH
jgi:hypothetical protein